MEGLLIIFKTDFFTFEKSTHKKILALFRKAIVVSFKKIRNLRKYVVKTFLSEHSANYISTSVWPEPSSP